MIIILLLEVVVLLIVSLEVAAAAAAEVLGMVTGAIEPAEMLNGAMLYYIIL